MYKVSIVSLLILCGCTASFQPYPAVTQQDLLDALKVRDANIATIAQALNQFEAALQPPKAKDQNEVKKLSK